jgi:hypothetical protein
MSIAGVKCPHRNLVDRKNGVRRRRRGGESKAMARAERPIVLPGSCVLSLLL